MKDVLEELLEKLPKGLLEERSIVTSEAKIYQEFMAHFSVLTTKHARAPQSPRKEDTLNILTDLSFRTLFREKTCHNDRDPDVSIRPILKELQKKILKKPLKEIPEVFLKHFSEKPSINITIICRGYSWKFRGGALKEFSKEIMLQIPEKLLE